MSSSKDRRATTPPGILSFPDLFKARSFKNADGTETEPKFGGVLVWTPAMKVNLDKLKAIVAVAGAEKFGEEGFKKLLKSKKYRSPFRNADEDEVRRYPEGSIYITAKSKDKPGLVSKYKDPKTGKAAVITDPEEFYPGALVAFSVTAFGYDVMGNKGVSFAINNVQKVGDGPRLDNRIKAEDEFSAEDAEEASLDEVDNEEEAGGEEDLTSLM